MKIIKTKKVKTPEYGTKFSAGIDFFVPDDFGFKTLSSGQDALIPSGIRCKVPHGCALIAFNKSGVSTKNKLQVGACVVDEDYTGEIHLHVYNYSNDQHTIKGGDKLVQFILIPIQKHDIEVVKEYVVEETKERGEGGFGSTNSKKDFSKDCNNIANEYYRSLENNMMIARLPGKCVYLNKIDVTKNSIKGTGTYQRHYFRDVDDKDKTYILDVTSKSSGIFKHLNLGDVLNGVQVFTTGNKEYINGKSRPEFIGKFDEIKHKLIKEKGFSI